MLLQTSLKSRILVLRFFVFNSLKSTIYLRRVKRQKQVTQVTRIHQNWSAKAQCKQYRALKSFSQDIWQVLYNRQYVDEKVRLCLFTASYHLFKIDWDIHGGEVFWISEEVCHLLLIPAPLQQSRREEFCSHLPNLTLPLWKPTRIRISITLPIHSFQSPVNSQKLFDRRERSIERRLSGEQNTNVDNLQRLFSYI